MYCYLVTIFPCEGFSLASFCVDYSMADSLFLVERLHELIDAIEAVEPPS